MEKKERADRVQTQKKRIADMCATQRVKVNLTLSSAGAAIVNPAGKTAGKSETTKK